MVFDASEVGAASDGDGDGEGSWCSRLTRRRAIATCTNDLSLDKKKYVTATDDWGRRISKKQDVVMPMWCDR